MSAIDALLEQFPPVSLTDLNARAGLMTRRDNKYLLTTEQLAGVLHSLEGDVDVLEIEERRRFRYLSVYLDTEDLHCFRDHNQSRAHRIKLRFRHYADSREAYFELKVKDRLNRTRKYRQPVDQVLLEEAKLTLELRGFLAQKLGERGSRLSESVYKHSIEVTYERRTLVHRSESVRITLDNRLHFASARNHYETDADLWVIEVKSERGRCEVDRLLVQRGIRPVPRCSKYCLGLTLTDSVKRVSRFTPTAKRIRMMCGQLLHSDQTPAI